VISSPVLENWAFPPPRLNRVVSVRGQSIRLAARARARACLCMVMLMCARVPITHVVSQEEHTFRAGVHPSRIGAGQGFACLSWCPPRGRSTEVSDATGV